MTFDQLNSLISPVTGHVLCDNGKVLVGNVQGIAVPTTGFPIGSLPDLTHNKTWVGDASNRPVEQNYIGDTTYVIRVTNSLLPSAQVLSDLYSLTNPTILKVVTDGYLALAIANVDYATTTELVDLADQAETSATNASNSADAAAASATAAAASATTATTAAGTAATAATAAATAATAAAASATSAAISASDAQGYLNTLLSTGLNALPNHGDVNMQGYRVKNVAQSPVEDFDAVTFKFLWDLLNNEVEILWS